MYFKSLKAWYNLPSMKFNSEDNTEKILKDQTGQTLVEFILLLLGIFIISFGFMATMNSNISDRWRAIAQIILDDKTQTLNIR